MANSLPLLSGLDASTTSPAMPAARGRDLVFVDARVPTCRVSSAASNPAARCSCSCPVATACSRSRMCSPRLRRALRLPCTSSRMAGRERSCSAPPLSAPPAWRSTRRRWRASARRSGPTPRSCCGRARPDAARRVRRFSAPCLPPPARASRPRRAPSAVRRTVAHGSSTFPPVRSRRTIRSTPRRCATSTACCSTSSMRGRRASTSRRSRPATAERISTGSAPTAASRPFRCAPMRPRRPAAAPARTAAMRSSTTGSISSPIPMRGRPACSRSVPTAA